MLYSLFRKIRYVLIYGNNLNFYLPLFSSKGGDIEKEAVVSALLLQTAPYMPTKKIMDPSQSKSNITTSTLIQTNNKKNPSSSNKNIIVNPNQISKKLTPKINKPKNTSTTQNVTVNAVKKAKKVPASVAVITLDANGVEIPKLSRRLQIQQKLEKKILKAAAEGVDIPTTSTKSTKQAVKVTPSPAVTTAVAAAPIVKANTNSKANRPSGTSVEGPNSGKKWVRREQDVTVSATSNNLGMTGSGTQSSLFTEPGGTSV